MGESNFLAECSFLEKENVRFRKTDNPVFTYWFLLGFI